MIGRRLSKLLQDLPQDQPIILRIELDNGDVVEGDLREVYASSTIMGPCLVLNGDQ